MAYVCMDNLLCDEVWLSKSSNTFEEVSDPVALKSYENEEFEEAFAVCLEKEVSFLPESDYTKYLHSNNLIFPRCRVIQWFIKVENLDYSFQSNVILKMELILLKVLGWRLNSVTSFSFVEMLSVGFLEPHLHEKFISRVIDLLIQATLDQKMLEFRPSIVGISALWCTLDQLFPPKSDTYIAYIMSILNQSQKDDIIKCHKLMETQTSMRCENHHCYCPLSPTTVLYIEHA
ncbi:hypothetical protein GLYMA_03G069200v4 [Glycine max]|nr:hypothetical protein GLYMA_03G069200v4 [Glycine max]KAH1068852.1 hypothetical protein GYH30_006429 [Glycine max]